MKIIMMFPILVRRDECLLTMLTWTERMRLFLMSLESPVVGKNEAEAAEGTPEVSLLTVLDKHVELELFAVPEDILAVNTGVVFSKFLMVKKAFLLILGEKLATFGAGVVLFLIQPAKAVVPEHVLIKLSLLEKTSFTVIKNAGKWMRLKFMIPMFFGRDQLKTFGTFRKFGDLLGN